MFRGEAILNGDDFSPAGLADEAAEVVMTGDAANRDTATMKVDEAPAWRAGWTVPPRPQGPCRPGHTQAFHLGPGLGAAKDQAEAVVASPKARQGQAIGFWAEGGQCRHPPEQGITPGGVIGAGRKQRGNTHPGSD